MVEAKMGPVAVLWRAGITAACNSVRAELITVGFGLNEFSFGPCAVIGGREWVTLMNNRKPHKRDGVGPHGTRPDAGFDLKAVRTGIGAALRTLHSEVLREEVPDRVADLLRQLDQKKNADSA
jgi:Anti-sigma factor NepR